MMEPMELDPLAMIEAQRDRIRALTDENVQLTAAVQMLQKQVALNNGQIEDVTDQVVGAEIGKAELTS
jgi:hypothetical protein